MRAAADGEVVYSGTKGAVIAFGKALARETATKGITVNIVCPGPTDTALLKELLEDKTSYGETFFVPVRARWHEPWHEENGDEVPALKDLKQDIGNLRRSNQCQRGTLSASSIGENVPTVRVRC